MSQYLDKDGASRIAENFLSKQAEQDAILANLQFDLKEAEHALVKTIQGPAPLNIRALTRPLDDYAISGNTVQNGTPTPDNPVDVVGCGVRTKNVMPAGEKKTVEVNGVTFSSDGNGRYHISGTASQETKVQFNLVTGFTIPVSVSKGGQGTLSFFNDKEYITVRLVFCNGSTEIDDWGLLPKNRTHTEYNLIGNKYVDSIRITVSAGTTADVTIMPEFTDDGILPSEFEPYGYKLPITVNGTEYPIYLGQVESTRRIKKLVMTGGESWVKASDYTYYIEINDYLHAKEITSMSTHYLSQINISSGDPIAKGSCCFYYGPGDGVNILYFKTITPYSTLQDFKSYLAAQYAAGTPATVWYVLAEPETGIVNEPLHKIGDYADTISMTQAGVTLTTTKGFNAITTDTTVLPSNIEVKGVINNA